MAQAPTIPTGDEYSRRLASALKQAVDGKNAGSTAKEAVAADKGAATAKEPADPGSAPAQPAGSGEHVVREGECVSSIARQTGHFWQTIWDDAANAELKAVRRQPNVLMSDDRVTIPPLRKKLVPCESEMRHRFRRRGEPSHLAIRVLDQDVPRANQPFKLIVDGQQTIEGMTDAEGKLDVPIPGTARKGKLVVGVEPDVLEYDLDLGGLDPVETWKGVQTRLKNLGIECDISGVKDDQTMEAVNEFRQRQGLPPVKDLDEATRTQLQEKHGS